jgi:hypothetical protein
VGSDSFSDIIKFLIQVSDYATAWRLINYIDTKAKFRHLKKLSCKGTLRQVFILEIHSVMLVFSAELFELLPSPLLSGSTLSNAPFLVFCVQCGGGLCMEFWPSDR